MTTLAPTSMLLSLMMELAFVRVLTLLLFLMEGSNMSPYTYQYAVADDYS